METTNNEMTAERSLEIIRKSIEESRRVVSRNMGRPLLMWGVLILATALLIGHLWHHTGNGAWNFLWLAMTVVGFVLEHLVNRRASVRAIGIIPTLLGNTWLTFGLFAIGTFIGLIIAFNLWTPIYSHVSFTSVIVLLMGMATAFSGFVIKNRLLTICGFLAGILGFILGLYVDGGYQMLIIAGMALIGMVIPGLYLERQNK